MTIPSVIHFYKKNFLYDRYPSFFIDIIETSPMKIFQEEKKFKIQGEILFILGYEGIFRSLPLIFNNSFSVKEDSYKKIKIEKKVKKYDIFNWGYVSSDWEYVHESIHIDKSYFSSLFSLSTPNKRNENILNFLYKFQKFFPREIMGLFNDIFKNFKFILKYDDAIEGVFYKYPPPIGMRLILNVNMI